MYFFIMSTTEEVKKAHNCRKYAIDGPADWLNRIFMPTLMVIFCFINLSQLWSPDDANISCVGFKESQKDFAEEYCWTQGIYTNRLAYHLPSDTVPYPGVVPCIAVLDSHFPLFKCSDTDKEEDLVYHLWYQWVPFYYTLVAVGYYLPYLVLKSTKLHHVKPMIKELLDPDIVETHHNQLIARLSTWMFMEMVYPRYCKISPFLRFWYDYGLVFTVIIVKVMYFTIAVSHMWLTCQMFHIGDWLRYGVDFLKVPDNSYETPTKDVLFPKMVSCQVISWGPTGQDSTTGMCTLVNNVLNQYLFLITWYMNVLLITVNLTSTILTFLKFLNPDTVHRSIVMTSMMEVTQDFGRMFGYVGPSGRILLSKMSEHMPGFILERIAKKVLVMIDKEQKKHKGKASRIKFTRIKGQNSEIARAPLMEISAMAFGIMPMAPGPRPDQPNKMD